MSRTVMSVVLASLIGSASVGALAANEGVGFYVGVGYGAVKLPDEVGDFSNPKNGSIDFGYSFSENWAVEAQISNSVSEGSMSVEASGYDITYETRADLVQNRGFTPTQAMQAVQSATADYSTKADLSVDTYGLYGVYRTSGALYAKVKAGITSIKTTADISLDKAVMTVVNSSNVSSTVDLKEAGMDLGSFSDEDTSFSESETEASFGIGAGYKVSDKFAVELEFIRLSSDLDSYSLSAKYHF